MECSLKGWGDIFFNCPAIVPSFASCVNISKLLRFLEPQFSHLSDGDNESHLIRWQCTSTEERKEEACYKL